MTATDELRRLLDERGVEHIDNDDERDETTEPLTTTWEYTQCGYEMVVTATEVRDTENKPYLDMDFHHYFTPEQAIAATLGRGECEMEPSFTVPSRLDFMQEYRCTECDEYAYLQIATDDDALRFCPNCGAKVVKQ